MRFTSKVLLATTSVVALTGAAQAQQVLINQSTTGQNVLDSANTSTLINSSGFGSVTLQAFQDATNAVNNASAVYGTSVPPGSVTQTISTATAPALDIITNNTIAGFSANGAQLVLGSQGIASNVNAAGLTLGNGAIVTVQQNSPGAIEVDQNNIMSAGYNEPSGGTFGIGQGPAMIQGQSIGAGGVVNNFGFQNNGFNLNTASIGVAGASATVGVAQKPGAITSVQTNFADAGQASPTFIDPSITALNQTVTANVNQIESIGAASGSTLILDGAGSGSSKAGVQSIGSSSLDSFTVQNTARALTWNATSGSTGTGAYGSNSGGNGDVSIRSSVQSVGLDFNSVTAGTTATPQNVNFGGTSAGSFDQTATYGSSTTATTGITVVNQPVGGFANFGVTPGLPNDAPVNVSFAGTANGAADVTNVGQIATASLNSATVTGAVNGNLNQTANINTDTVSSGAAVGVGPQLSNFAGAVVQAQGPSTLSNVDQTSALSSNSLNAASVGADGLQLIQAGYQTSASNNTSTSGTVNPGLSSNVLVAGTPTATTTTLGSNSTITGSAQTLVNTQNTFSAATTASAALGSTPAQLTVSQDLSSTLDTGYGGDNFASANAGSGLGVASLSSGSQVGGVNLNSVTVGSTGANTQTAVTQTGGTVLEVGGNNTASANGKMGTITGYGQSYDVALNTVSLGGSGAKDVTQTSGEALIATSNTLTAEAGGTSPFASAMIGGSLGASQSLTAGVNSATTGGIGSLVQTAGPINSTLNNTVTATAASSSASSITGLVQTTSQSINTGN